MAPPRLLADEMVGRLARYLRMLGCDTTYARGWSDSEIVRRARAEDRIVVTRDRELARRAPGALLLTSPELAAQLGAVWARFPDVPTEVRFERCTLCDGRLERIADPGAAEIPPELPAHVRASGGPIYRCVDCGHPYWEGSHTADVRRRLREWAGRGPG